MQTNFLQLHNCDILSNKTVDAMLDMFLLYSKYIYFPTIYYTAQKTISSVI